ncbi:hypothetical protein K438DRAFT_1976148 [Mycena galopus ATCC 62051]|nr:hypothetical protein K438DRAFT_1976148 [Mycena galopus ATCC 62051]
MIASPIVYFPRPCVQQERERRQIVVRANSSSNLNPNIVTANGGDTASVRTQSSGSAKEREGGEEAEWWAMNKAESCYRENCEGCQEQPDKGITVVFKVQHTINASPDRRFLSVQLTFTTASILADVLSIEWGLRKAVFKECDLDDLVRCLFLLCFALAYYISISSP